MSRSQESQKAMIRAWLEEGHTLTSREALDRFGCARLGARIYDLRQDLELEHSEAVIQSKLIPVKTRFGVKTEVSQYWMEPGRPERPEQAGKGERKQRRI